MSWANVYNSFYSLREEIANLKDANKLSELKIQEILSKADQIIESNGGVDAYPLHRILNEAIKDNNIFLFNYLIEKGVSLGQGKGSSLKCAAIIGNIELFDKIINLIQNDQSRYETEYNSLFKDNNLARHLEHAVHSGNIDFINYLIKKNKNYFQKQDQGNISAINILFANAHHSLDKEDFLNIYLQMLSDGFKDITYDVNNDFVDGIFATLIKFQDKKRLIELLKEGKDLKIFDHSYHSPQEIIKKGTSLQDVADKLINNEFKFKDRIELDEVSLHPSSKLYTSFNIAKMDDDAKIKLKYALIDFLSDPELGCTKLDVETEKKIYDRILSFLLSENPLFLSKLDRLDAAFQLLYMVRNPESLEQGEHNLCGVATFIQQLADNNPLDLLDEMIEYCENGKTRNPDFIQFTGKFNEDNKIFHSFIKAFKNYNSFYGYYTTPKNLEPIIGATKSKSISDWMEKAGFTDVTETWIAKNTSGKEISMLHRGVLGGMYSNKRKMKRDEEQLDAILQAHHDGKAIALSISPLLASKKLFLPAQEEEYWKNIKKMSILGVVLTHWVNLKDIEYHEEEQLVHLKYYTYGEIVSCAIPVRDFTREINGMVAGIPPKHLKYSLAEDAISTPIPHLS